MQITPHWQVTNTLTTGWCAVRLWPEFVLIIKFGYQWAIRPDWIHFRSNSDWRNASIFSIRYFVLSFLENMFYIKKRKIIFMSVTIHCTDTHGCRRLYANFDLGRDRMAKSNFLWTQILVWLLSGCWRRRRGRRGKVCNNVTVFLVFYLCIRQQNDHQTVSCYWFDHHQSH